MSGKVNHHSLKYKQRANPNKTYKDLKQKQKQRIADWMFQEACLYFKNNNKMPSIDDSRQIVDVVYQKIRSAAIWVPYEDVFNHFQKNLTRWEARINRDGIPEKTEHRKTDLPVKTKRKRKKKNKSFNEPTLSQDDYFFFIAGYTSGGAPYGLTWEEMGLAPYEKSE